MAEKELFELELGRIGETNLELCFLVKENLEKMFPLRIYKAGGFPLPERAFEPKRAQYLAHLVLEELEEKRRGKQMKLLALTEADLGTPVLSYVFGASQLGGKVGLVSFHRLRPEFYNLPAQPELFLQRTLQTTFHELGHLFRIKHCPEKNCVMHRASTILELDLKGTNYCHTCQEQFQRSLAEERIKKFLAQTQPGGA